MKVMILTADSNGGYPVPAVKGGAVSTLIEHLVAGNNEKQLCKMEIVSLYNSDAEKKAIEKYPNIKFRWVRIPGILKIFDKCMYNFIRLVKKKEKAISFRSPFSLIYYIHKAKKIVNDTDADKVVLENNIPLIRVMKRSHFRGQWYYHFHNVPRIDAGCRGEFKKITKFLCVSQFVANQITGKKSAIGQIDPTKIAVLYNCVDTELFKPIDKNNPRIQNIKQKFGIKADDYICIFTGRLSEEKGADKVLEAVKKTDDTVKCLVVGSLFSEFNSKTEYQIKLKMITESIADKVIFTGYINQNALPYYYNIANVAVLPSIWDEPAGLTNIEAMACGIPVITTDAGGIPEYTSIINHIKRSSDIIEKIVNEIRIYMYNSEYANEIAEKSYVYVKKNFDAHNYIDNFVKILNC